MEFQLTIKLGNAAMLTTSDLAHALAETAERIDAREDFPLDPKLILDGNGNAVGFWKFADV